MSVEFKAKHRKLLEQALDALGMSWTETFDEILNVDGLGCIDLEKGIATIDRYSQRSFNQLKQQYSKEALKRAAKLQGWQLKTKGQMKGVLRR